MNSWAAGAGTATRRRSRILDPNSIGAESFIVSELVGQGRAQHVQGELRHLPAVVWIEQGVQIDPAEVAFRSSSSGGIPSAIDRTICLTVAHILARTGSSNRVYRRSDVKRLRIERGVGRYGRT